MLPRLTALRLASLRPIGRPLACYSSAAAQSYAPTVQADLTWTGERFEENVEVRLDGDRIASIGAAAADGSQSSSTQRLRGVALLPGLVNAHSHSFQRSLRGKGEVSPPQADVESSFWTWRDEMYRLVAELDAEGFYRVTRQCYEEMRASGITTVAEFHYFHHGKDGADSEGGRFQFDDIVLQAAKDAGVRVVLLNTCYAHGGFGEVPLSR